MLNWMAITSLICEPHDAGRRRVEPVQASMKGDQASGDGFEGLKEDGGIMIDLAGHVDPYEVIPRPQLSTKRLVKLQQRHSFFRSSSS